MLNEALRSGQPEVAKKASARFKLQVLQQPLRVETFFGLALEPKASRYTVP